MRLPRIPRRARRPWSARGRLGLQRREGSMPESPRFAYTKGLHEVGSGCFAYLQPDGSWGWSNAGLVTDAGESLLVDTLFDLRLTREMLDAMRRATTQARRIGTLGKSQRDAH